MKKQTLTLEHVLYFLILILGLGIRILSVGNLPLSDFEADPAVRAVQVAQGEPAELGTQPGYVLLTGLAFFLMGSSEATARLWPVLAGSALILVPFFLRDRLGRKAALVVAAGLALDPGLVAVSQLAGGPMMAVSFVLLAGVAWLSGGMIAAGILTGLALLSGPTVLMGMIGLAASIGIGRIMGLFDSQEEDVPEEGSSTKTSPSPIRAGLVATGGTLLLAGTLFLRYPQGLSAFASALPAFMEGWAVPSGVSINRLLLTFVSYPLPAFLFGIIAVVRAWTGQEESNRVGRALSVWLVVALILVFVYPGRQVADLAWALIPLWGLAGLELGRYLYLGEDETHKYIPWALAGLVVVMMMSAWANLAGLAATTPVPGSPDERLYLLRWLVIGGAILLAILSAVLVGLGWSSDAAKRGLAWGGAISLGFGMLGGIWGTTPRQLANREDVWKPVPGAGEQTLFLQTLGDLSDWTTGRDDSLEIISLVDSPSIRWALRAAPNVRFQTSLNRGDLPEAIITRQDQAELSLGSAYRGQDFVWWVYPNYDAWTGQQWLKWLAFHEGTTGMENVIVWARGDLFPSGGTVSEIPPDPEVDLTGEDEEFVPDEEIIDREDPLK